MTKKLLHKIEDFTESNPQIRGGQLVFKGTRILVVQVVEHIQKGWSTEEVGELFPQLDQGVIDMIANTILEMKPNETQQETEITWLPYT